MTAIISTFNNFWETQTPVNTTLDIILAAIRNGGKDQKIKQAIERLRSEKDPAQQDRIKKTELPCICFSGKFLQRNDGSMEQHSGYCIMDFDGMSAKTGASIQECRDYFRQFPFVVAAFISPRGDGIKVLVRIPASKENHRAHYAALLEAFPLADPTSRNESRICFASYDPDLYYNPEAEEFTEIAIPEPEKPVAPANQAKTDYRVLNQLSAMIRGAEAGARHENLIKASRLAGGWIAAGYIEEDVVVPLLEKEFRSRPGTDPEYNAKATIQAGITHGKLTPLYEQQYDAATADGTPIQTDSQTHSIVFVSDVSDTMTSQYHEGKPRGLPTHFPGLDTYWTWKQAEKTIISGMPGDGKSEFIFQLMILKAVYDDWKFACFAPENWPAEEFYDTLITMLVGMSVDPMFGQQMPIASYEDAKRFINAHFFYIDIKTEKNIKVIRANFKYCIEEKGCQATLTDPFNRIVAEKDYLRDDKFISDYMDQCAEFNQYHNVCDITVVHPAPTKMRQKENGEYPQVHPYHLAGGGMWFNKMDNYLSVYRPMRVRDPSDPTVEIHIGKIKRARLVGKLGTLITEFNVKTNRHYFETRSGLEDLENPYDLVSRNRVHGSVESLSASRVRTFPEGVQTNLDDWEPQKIGHRELDNDVPY